MRAWGKSRHHTVRAALAALLVAASAMAPLAAQTSLPPNLPRPTGPDRHHADKCALFVIAGRIGQGHILTGTDESDRRLRAIIDRLQQDVFWDDMVLRCPHFTVRSSGRRIGQRGLDGFGWSANGRYASIADNYLPNRLGASAANACSNGWRIAGGIAAASAPTGPDRLTHSSLVPAHVERPQMGRIRPAGFPRSQDGKRTFAMVPAGSLRC